MLPCHNLWDLEEQRGRGFLNLSYGGKGKSHKQEELLWGAIKKLPKELTLNYSIWNFLLFQSFMVQKNICTTQDSFL